MCVSSINCFEWNALNRCCYRFKIDSECETLVLLNFIPNSSSKFIICQSYECTFDSHFVICILSLQEQSKQRHFVFILALNSHVLIQIPSSCATKPNILSAFECHSSFETISSFGLWFYHIQNSFGPLLERFQLLSQTIPSILALSLSKKTFFFKRLDNWERLACLKLIQQKYKDRIEKKTSSTKCICVLPPSGSVAFTKFVERPVSMIYFVSPHFMRRFFQLTLSLSLSLMLRIRSFTLRLVCFIALQFLWCFPLTCN